MEKNFCGKCGRLVSECICGDSAVIPAVNEPATRAGERYEGIALAQGETVVKSYPIGKYKKFFGLAGKGTATLILTNRRVICKLHMRQNSTTANLVEEIALNEVSGVKTYYASGLNTRRLIIGILAVIVAIVGLIGSVENGMEMLTLTGAGIPVALWMFLTMRKSRYLFSIHTRADSTAMTMGAKVRGRMARVGSGIAFQYEPTKEVEAMMNEMGACIMDMKARGSAAVNAWKKV